MIRKENILIYGSGTDSILVKKALDDSKASTLNVFAFIDDNQDKINKHIEQKKVYHSNSITLLKDNLILKKSCSWATI